MRSRLRLALILVLLAGSIVGVSSTRASAGDDDGGFKPAWTMIENVGYWGDYFYWDSSGSSGGRCSNSGSAVDIKLVGPVLYTNALHSAQPVTVDWELYKILSNGSLNRVRQSSAYSATAYHNYGAVYGDLSFYDLSIGPT